MICTSFLWCAFFFTTFDISWGYEDPFIIPVCEEKGPDDVYFENSNAGLTKLSKYSGFDASIKCLNFEGNNINYIDNDAFDSFPELYYLNLAKNPIHVKNFIGTAIPNLEILILDGPFPDRYYGHFDAYDMYKPDNLEWSLSLPELRKLSLRYYHGDYFSKLVDLWLTILDVPNLTHLYLAESGVTEITNLERLPHLTHLNADDNNMRYISGSFLKNLEYLSLDRNNFLNVCGTFCNLDSMTPREMHNLKYLSLADNKIENIGSDAFVHLENLLVLNLAGNKIQDFPRHVFDNMTNLKNLTLDKNNLMSVPNIHALQELQVLSLNGNNIHYISGGDFHDMPKLATVYLRQNNMFDIGNNIFVNVPSLTMLDLSSNVIELIPNDWISPNNTLKVLKLDDNKFMDIHFMSLKRLEALDTLSAVNNPIKEISIRSLMELPINITIKLSPD